MQNSKRKKDIYYQINKIKGTIRFSILFEKMVTNNPKINDLLLDNTIKHKTKVIL